MGLKYYKTNIVTHIKHNQTIHEWWSVFY